MFFRRIGIGLVAQHFQCFNHFRPCASGVDNIVNIALAGSNIGVGEFVPVLGNQFLSCLLRFFRLIYGAFEDDVYGTIRSHHGDFSRWPGIYPGTSTSVITGMLKQSQKRTNLAPLSAASTSMAPAYTDGCWVTIPTLYPPILAKPTIRLLAKLACTSIK